MKETNLRLEKRKQESNKSLKNKTIEKASIHLDFKSNRDGPFSVCSSLKWAVTYTHHCYDYKIRYDMFKSQYQTHNVSH